MNGGLGKEKFKTFFSKKSVRVVLVLLIALALLLAVWKVFFPKEKGTADYPATDEESRLSLLLSQIEGVEEASVMIGEEDGTPVSAVVVFRGEDGILLRSRLIEAAARALGLENGAVHVYPANKK